MQKKITAKFNSKCAETRANIKKGEQMIYDYSTKKCYTLTSNFAKNYLNNQDGAAGMIQANEDAYFDSFCYRNNI